MLLGLSLLGFPLPSCTLTQDGFEPVLTEAGPVQPGDAPPDAPPPISEAPSPVSEAPAPSSEPDCTASPDCPAGFVCMQDTCVASPCAGEDSAACNIACVDGACALPQCSDGAQGGDESGVDCGGPCPPCALDAPCGLDSDCPAGSCIGGRCTTPSCSDGLTNQDESGPDCGGGCGPCSAGVGCAAASDCESAVCGTAGCAEGVATCCQAVSCEDGVRNGDEGAVDCGNDACGPCAASSPCSSDAECASNTCADGTCATFCTDARLSGDESALDCGGTEPGCPRCEDGRACASGADCANGRCDGGTCSSCADGLQTGDELGLDCGSSQLGCPACTRCSVENSTDLGRAGTVTTATANACVRITTFPSYAPTLFECFEDGPYPVPLVWSQECTGQAGSAVCVSPFQMLPLTGLSLDCPVVFELHGSDAPLRLRWF